MRRLGDILTAINAHCVVWVDDIERFAGADGGRALHAFEGLMDLLGHTRGITVALCRSSDMQSTSPSGDWARLATRWEGIPPLSGDKVVPMVAALWRVLRDEYPEDVMRSVLPAHSAFRSFATGADIVSTEFIAALVTRHPGEWAAITRILNTPRVLKASLRLTRDAWSKLHGEVSLEDLLFLQCLRASRARVVRVSEDGRRLDEHSAFDVILAHPDWCVLGGSNVRKSAGESELVYRDGDENTGEQLAFEQAAVSESQLLGHILRELFPRFKTPRAAASTPQASIARDGLYLRRGLAESVIDGKHDQPVLRRLRDADAEREAGPATAALASVLLRDNAESACILHFQEQVSTETTRRVLRELTRQLLEGAASEYADQMDLPGYAAGAHLLHRAFPLAHARTAFVWRAMRDAMPKSLLVAYKVQYWWVNRDRDAISEPHGPDPLAFIRRVPNLDVAGFRRAFCRCADGHAKLGNATSPTQAYVWHWLVRRHWNAVRERARCRQYDYVQAARWRRVSGLFLEAVRLQPDRCWLPLAALASNRGDYAQNPSPLSETRYVVDRFFTRRLFGCRYPEALQLLASMPRIEISEEHRPVAEGVAASAQELLCKRVYSVTRGKLTVRRR